MRAGFAALERDLPGIGEQAEWLTELVPRAILDGDALPAAAAAAAPRRPAARLGLRA